MSNIDRYCYFSPDLVSSDEYKAGYQLAHDLSKQKKTSLTLCVNSIKNNQFVEKIFNTLEKNKLHRYQTITDRSVKVRLKSPKGIDAYEDYGVVLAVHPSQEAIEKLEANSKLHTLVVVAEVPHNGIYQHLNDWAKKHNAIVLRISH